MNTKNSPTMQASFLDRINKNVGFVVWSGIGTGSLATILDYFDKPEYQVQRVIMPRVSNDTFMVMPVLDANKQIGQYISNEMQAIKTARDTSGKKLVLIFDDLSSSTVAGSRAFYDAVINRKFGGIDLNDTDIVLAVGSLDSEGNMINNVIPQMLLNKVSHYVLHHAELTA